MDYSTCIVDQYTTPVYQREIKKKKSVYRNLFWNFNIDIYVE